MAINAKQLLSRNERLKEDRTLWDGFYQDVVDFMRMGKQALTNSESLVLKGISITTRLPLTLQRLLL